MDKNFNPFYDSKFLISIEGDEDFGRRMLVEMPEEDLRRLREEIDVVLGHYGKNNIPAMAFGAEPVITESKVMLKISPEEMDMINDVLNLNHDEILAKYGGFTPGEDGLEFCTPTIGGPAGKNGVLYISIYPMETDEDEPRIKLTFYAREVLASSKQPPIHVHLKGIYNFEREYSVTDQDGHKWTVDLHADERLRRIGREYVFQSDCDVPPFVQHDGQTCTVLQQTPVSENDPLAENMMWKVQFQDGTILDAWDFELSHTPDRQADLNQNPAQQKPVKHPKLDNMIASAENSRSNQTSGKASPQPER